MTRLSSVEEWDFSIDRGICSAEGGKGGLPGEWDNRRVLAAGVGPGRI